MATGEASQRRRAACAFMRDMCGRAGADVLRVIRRRLNEFEAVFRIRNTVAPVWGTPKIPNPKSRKSQIPRRMTPRQRAAWELDVGSWELTEKEAVGGVVGLDRVLVAEAFEKRSEGAGRSSSSTSRPASTAAEIGSVIAIVEQADVPAARRARRGSCASAPGRSGNSNRHSRSCCTSGACPPTMCRTCSFAISLSVRSTVS